MSKLQLALVGVEWDMIDLIESLPEYDFLGIIESAYPQYCYDIPCLGTDADWPSLKKKHPDLTVLIAVDVPSVRSHLIEHYGNDSLANIRSPRAYISSRATVGHGTVLQRGVQIMPRASVGIGCKINIDAIVHHESTVGKSCTIAPGARILSRVVIEDEVYIGAGAIIKQRCRIGRGAIIGAGAVVIRDIPPHTTVAGVPAKPLYIQKTPLAKNE